MPCRDPNCFSPVAQFCLLAAHASGDECPVGFPCICSSVACDPGEKVDTDLFLSSELIYVLPPGCSVATSQGTLSVAGAAIAFSSGSTEGVCGDDMCFSVDLDIDAQAMVAPDLTMTPINLGAQAEAITAYARGSGELDGMMDPLVFRTTLDSHGEFNFGKLECATLDQTLDYHGLGLGGGFASGSRNTTLAGTCSGLSASLLLTMQKTMVVNCDPECESCPINGAVLCAIYATVQVETGSANSPGPGSTQNLSGLYALRRNGDGTLSPIQMGCFDVPDFDPVGQQDTLEVPITIPAGTSVIDSATSIDVIGKQTGDIDGNGRTCPADAALMNELIGVAFGDPGYTPRADFDLDGLITAADQQLFDAAYAEYHAPELCVCPADIDGDGEVGFGDLLAVLSSWGAVCNPDPCPADIDGNGQVDFADLLTVLADWGPCA